MFRIILLLQARLNKNTIKTTEGLLSARKSPDQLKIIFLFIVLLKTKKVPSKYFFFLFCNKSLWESFPAWKNKKEEKNVFVVVGYITAFSPILSTFWIAIYSFVSKSLFPLVETMGALFPTVYQASSFQLYNTFLADKVILW